MAIPVSWNPKDPDETVNYELPWASQLVSGDTIAPGGSVWSDVTGVVLEADTISDDALSTYARVSGGVDGVPASLTNTITTVDGETLELLVLLPIVANALAPLVGYENPTPNHLVARYPAFAVVPYQTIAIHLNDALSGVDESWEQADYAPAIIALAAHNMSLLGMGDEGEVAGYRRAGVSSLRDGAFSVSFNEKCVGAASGGKFEATQYGRIYATLLRRNRGGPRLVGGAAPPGGWGPLGRLNDGGIVPWAF
jgi:hypothetical protein